MFSKACEYGIRAIIYIAMQSMEGNRVKIGDVADHTSTPEAFTAKILGKLTKHNIVTSLKGPYGGFEIDVNRMKQISISEIVYAIDGSEIFTSCTLGLSQCRDDEPCPMHGKFVKIRKELRKAIETTSIYDLATQIKEGKAILRK